MTDAPVTLKERALLARHTAAMELLRQGREDDGLLLLSYVVCPSERLSSGTPRPISQTSRRAHPGCHQARRIEGAEHQLALHQRPG